MSGNGWSKVARWAGFGENKDLEEGTHEMQDDVVTLDGELVPGEQSGPEMAAEERRQESGVGSAELEQVRGERDQLKDRLARLQAEFDNARKREAKERADSREYTVGATVEPFLGVMDNFGLALKAQGSAEQLRGGVELILKQMDEALKGLGVTSVPTVGVEFDPRIHEALGSVETAEFPDHHVVEEIRKGYKIREKLLRPAMVKIAVNPGQVND